MQRTQAVQVVLGEGEPGILRFVLEAEGFHVVGQARGEAELRQVLAVTDPAVIVLDAGISAQAALEARRSSDGASVVVVWPTGVVAAVADERVDPASVLHDLGGAVRRAATRTTTRYDDDIVVRIPDAAPTAPVVPLRRGPDAVRTQPRPRRHRVLVVAATWTVVLGASAAIGLTIPRAFDPVQRARPHPPSASATAPARSIRGQTEQPSSSGRGTPRECARAAPAGHRTERGRPDDPGRRCGEGAGRTENSHGNGNGNGAGGRGNGRPDDPGANGNRPAHSEEPGPKPGNGSPNGSNGG